MQGAARLKEALVLKPACSVERRNATMRPAGAYFLLAALTVLCLLPFSGRAFHTDDTLFIWAAQNITKHPFNPYGFQLNWEFTQVRMSEVTQNPPLASYYMALAGSVVGWSERALHLAFLLPTLALVLGTYRLAQKFTRSPLLVAFATLLTPGLLVSVSSTMCDPMMLAIWMWAAILWIEGLEPQRPLFLAASALLLAVGELTKYFGASLVPEASRARHALEWTGKFAHHARVGRPRRPRGRSYGLYNAPPPLVPYKQSPDSFHRRWNFRPGACGRGLLARTRCRLAVPCIMGPGHICVYRVLELDHQCAQRASTHSRNRHSVGPTSREDPRGSQPTVNRVNCRRFVAVRVRIVLDYSSRYRVGQFGPQRCLCCIRANIWQGRNRMVYRTLGISVLHGIVGRSPFGLAESPS